MQLGVVFGRGELATDFTDDGFKQYISKETKNWTKQKSGIKDGPSIRTDSFLSVFIRVYPWAKLVKIYVHRNH
jgi:hypothetical protein